MDRLTRTANIIKAYYSYKKNSDSATFIKEVCGFFDFIKSEPISEADMNFLLFLANEAGIPQYFDLLKDKFTECRISDEKISICRKASAKKKHLSSYKWLHLKFLQKYLIVSELLVRKTN